MKKLASIKSGGGASSGLHKVAIVTFPGAYRGGNTTVNVKAILPDVYNKLTLSNFVYDVTGEGNQDWNFGTWPPIVAYDPVNGILTYCQYAVLGHVSVYGPSGDHQATGKAPAGTIYAVY